MPGYSSTPLPKKLGIKPGFRVHLANCPAEVRAELREALAQCDIVERGTALDFVMIFTKSRAELSNQFPRVAKVLAPAGMLWVGWPKKSSGVATDLDENVMREIGLDGPGRCEGVRRDRDLVRAEVCAPAERSKAIKGSRPQLFRPVSWKS